MKSLSVLSLVAASAVAANAQVTVNNGTYTCAKAGAFCAGDSLKTDIIIRCSTDLTGQPGRCSDNLSGEPPVGNTPALCWQTSDTSADAACEKNCVVYGGSGNSNGTFTLPADQCTPTFTASTTSTSTSVASSTSTSVSVETSTVSSSSAETSAVTTSTFSTPSNGTTITQSPSGTSATATPVGPSSTTVHTAAAVANKVGSAVAALGLAAAYLI